MSNGKAALLHFCVAVLPSSDHDNTKALPPKVELMAPKVSEVAGTLGRDCAPAHTLTVLPITPPDSVKLASGACVIAW